MDLPIDKQINQNGFLCQYQKRDSEKSCFPDYRLKIFRRLVDFQIEISERVLAVVENLNLDFHKKGIGGATLVKNLRSICLSKSCPVVRMIFRSAPSVQSWKVSLLHQADPGSGWIWTIRSEMAGGE